MSIINIKIICLEYLTILRIKSRKIFKNKKYGQFFSIVDKMDAFYSYSDSILAKI